MIKDTIKAAATAAAAVLLFAGCSSNDTARSVDTGQPVHSPSATVLSGCGAVGNQDENAPACPAEDENGRINGGGSCCGDTAPPPPHAPVVPDENERGLIGGSGSGGSGDIPPPPAPVISGDGGGVVIAEEDQ